MSGRHIRLKHYFRKLSDKGVRLFPYLSRQIKIVKRSFQKLRLENNFPRPHNQKSW